MTTYIPQLTIPHAVFANPAASVLLPITLGTGVGFSISREPFFGPRPGRTYTSLTCHV